MSIENTSRLQHMPVALFATVMGMAGLTLAWKKAVAALNAPEVIWQVLLILTAVLLSTLTLSYLLKVIRFSTQVIAEFNHPIKISFFPAFSIGLMLISAGLVDSLPGIAGFLWALGASIQLILTLYLMNRWIHHTHWQIQHTTPAWFIPIVGNIIAPIAGVDLGFNEISWLFFSIGLVFWIVLKVLVFNRVIFHEPIPDQLLPTMVILVAPPAVGFVAYVKLNAGIVDNFAHILYYTAMFTVMLMLVQLPRFSRLPFFISWWAYSFPIAAFTIATQIMSLNAYNNLFFYSLSTILVALLSLLLTLLVLKTSRGILSGAIFQPD